MGHRKHKYAAERMVVDGIVFDSRREGRRYIDLSLLQKAGKIFDLELQPVYKLGTDENPIVILSTGYPNGRRVQYRADFRYRDADTGQIVVEDVKGFDTPAARLKRAVVEWQYKIAIRLV